MPPTFGTDGQFGNNNLDDSNERYEGDDTVKDIVEANLTQMAFWYMIVLVGMLLTWLLVYFCLRMFTLRQKTRSTPERRVYVGARPRPASYGQPEPTIYVSPANLPPPPKYEAMAPPSYEEVVGIHYPQYQQPIATPIVTALSHTSECRTNVVNPSSNVINPSSNVINPSSNVTDNESTVITVSTDERRTSVTVTSS